MPCPDKGLTKIVRCVFVVVVSGVVETGLFISMAEKAYFGSMTDGQVTSRGPKNMKNS